MELQGVRMEGVKYGQISPKDFAGLKVWLNPNPQNFVIPRGVNPSQWKDISNFLRVWTVGSSPLKNNAYWGYYLDIASVGGGSMSNTTADRFYDFLVNGSPFSVVIMAYAHSCYLQIGNITKSGPSYAFGPDVSNAPMNFRMTSLININNGTANTNRIISNTFTRQNGQYFQPPVVARPGILAMHTCYGLGAASPQHAIFSNARTTPDYVTDYLNAPSPNNVMADGALQVVSGGVNRAFEILIYDHTGKSRSQIDSEMNLLRTAYFTSVYKGIEQPNNGGTLSLLVNAPTKPATQNTISVVFRFNQSLLTPYLEVNLAVTFKLTYISNGVTYTVPNLVQNFGIGNSVQTYTYNTGASNSTITSITVSVTSVSPNPAGTITVTIPADVTATF